MQIVNKDDFNTFGYNAPTINPNLKTFSVYVVIDKSLCNNEAAKLKVKFEYAERNVRKPSWC